MSSKHTPGPYHVNAIAGNRVIGDETCTAGVDKYQICNANATVATVYRPRDAALLKSAPDLLAALKALRDLRDQWRKDDRFTSIDYMDAIDAMPWESAIARAEGTN